MRYRVACATCRKALCRGLKGVRAVTGRRRQNWQAACEVGGVADEVGSGAWEQPAGAGFLILSSCVYGCDAVHADGRGVAIGVWWCGESSVVRGDRRGKLGDVRIETEGRNAEWVEGCGVRCHRQTTKERASVRKGLCSDGEAVSDRRTTRRRNGEGEEKEEVEWKTGGEG